MHKSLVLAALLLAGCQLAPPHTRGDLPTATGYPAEYAGDVTLGRRATEIALADFLADPRLEALIAAALTRNRDLAVSVGRIEEARGLFRIQDADRLPTITGTADATRSRQSAGSFGGGGTGGIPGGGGDGGSGAVTFNRFSIGVGVSAFELDFWGRVRNLSEAARAQFLRTVQAERAFRLSLVRDVSSAYLASREAEERIALAEATVTSREQGLRIDKRRLDAGVTSALDFRQSESLLTQAQAELASLRRLKAESDNLLTVLTGGPVAGPLPAGLALAEQAAMPRVAAGLPSDLLVARPDVIAAEEDLRAARANIGAARAAFFPTISLTGTLGLASDSLGSLFDGDSFNYSIGPSVSLPFLDFGRTKGNLTVAQARENIAIASYERTIQGAFQEVADALAGRLYIAEQVTAQERGVGAQRAIARIARARYREGVANYLEVLDAERNLFAAEQALLQLRRAQVLNLVTLYVALGGGLVEGVPEPVRDAAGTLPLSPAPEPR